MKKDFGNRTLFTLSGSGVDLRGTCHIPKSWREGQDLYDLTVGRIGVVIVNALAMPRSGAGDSAVFWAEAFAGSGYPCFRVDLPGLGDTHGELPQELLSYMTDGGYASLITMKLRELVDNFGLDGVILMGHCAGGIAALHAAAEGAACSGLILIDPYFNYPRGIAKLLPRIAMLSRRNKAVRLLRDVYDLAREMPRALRKDRLPANANRALLRKWKRVTATGVPILILGSPWLKARPGYFDHFSYALQAAGGKSNISVEFIDEADHSFASLSGREGVRRQAVGWLSRVVQSPAQREQRAS